MTASFSTTKKMQLIPFCPVSSRCQLWTNSDVKMALVARFCSRTNILFPSTAAYITADGEPVLAAKLEVDDEYRTLIADTLENQGKKV